MIKGVTSRQLWILDAGVVKELWYLPTVCLHWLQTSWLVMCGYDAFNALAITLQGSLQHHAEAGTSLGLLDFKGLQGPEGSPPHGPPGGL